MALGLSLVASMASAEEPLYDLNEMPEGYSFVSEGSGEKTTLTYLGRSGDLFMMRYHTAYADGRSEIEVVLVNQESQTVSAMGGNGTTYTSPHDCFPSVGKCSHSYRSDGLAFSVRVLTEDVDGIWVAKRSIGLAVDDNWTFVDRTCVIYDDYGFWFDQLTVTTNGVSSISLRTDPPVEGDPETRLQRLRAACGVEVPLV